MTRKEIFQQVRGILVLPFTMTVLIPVFLWFTFTAPKADRADWLLAAALPPGACGLGLLC